MIILTSPADVKAVRFSLHLYVLKCSRFHALTLGKWNTECEPMDMSYASESNILYIRCRAMIARRNGVPGPPFLHTPDTHYAKNADVT